MERWLGAYPGARGRTRRGEFRAAHGRAVTPPALASCRARRAGAVWPPRDATDGRARGPPKPRFSQRSSAPDRAGLDFLHLLRHHTDIGGAITALVAEAIEFKPVIKPRQRHDVMLEVDVGTTATTTPAATPAATAATAAAHVTASAATAADARSTATFSHLRSATAFSHLRSAAALGPCHLTRAAIAKARLPSLREVFGLRAIAPIEGITSRPAFCLCTQIGLLALQRRLFP